METLSNNPGQNEICLHRHGPRRVNAGAGTGKTTSLVLRVKAMIEEDVPARHILVLTFTKKAAEDQKYKMRTLVGMDADDVTVGNFHSIALNEVREMTPREDSFGILDQTDSSDLWKQCFDESLPKMPEAFKEIADKIKDSSRAKKKPTPEKKWKNLMTKWAGMLRTAYSNRINEHKAHIGQFHDYAKDFLKRFDENFDIIDSIMDLKPWIRDGEQSYQDKKYLHRSKDFDDILTSWLDLLRKNPGYKNEIKNRWPYVIVDEYQDTNFLQEELLKELNTSNLMVVGDTAQCLYSWRQAVPDLMIQFPDRYAGAKDITLDINYRSYGRILELANGILKEHHQLLKEEHTNASNIPLIQLNGQKGPGGDVRIFHFQDNKQEANRVVNDIEALLKDGEKAENIAVLCRTSFYMQTAESFARTRGIKTQVWGGRSLLESRTVKETLALLKCVLRPKDSAPFKRIAQIFPKVGEKAAERAFLQKQMEVPVPEQLQELIEFLDTIHELRVQEREDKSVSNAMEIVDEAIEFMKVVYHDIYGEDDWKAIQELEALSDAFMAAKEAALEVLEQIPEDSPAHKALQLDEIMSQMSMNPLNKDPEDGAVTFSTIHQAKGMEWRHIFIMGVAEGTLPIIRKDEVPSPERIQEECRGLYVAVTRAMETLTITYAGKNPSRFLTNNPVAIDILEQSPKKWNSRPQWVTPPPEDDD